MGRPNPETAFSWSLVVLLWVILVPLVVMVWKIARDWEPTFG